MTKLIPRTLEGKLVYMNNMYSLPVAPHPTAQTVIDNEREKAAKAKVTIPWSQSAVIVKRLESFKKVVSDELREIEIIVGKLNDPAIEYGPIEFLTELADLLGDLSVFCGSEAVKFGIPLHGPGNVIDIIMQSNFSKLGADGQPIIDEDGKVRKGPNYWKPEPQIQALLLELMPKTITKIG